MLNPDLLFTGGLTFNSPNHQENFADFVMKGTRKGMLNNLPSIKIWVSEGLIFEDLHTRCTIPGLSSDWKPPEYGQS